MENLHIQSKLKIPRKHPENYTILIGLPVVDSTNISAATVLANIRL